jgi:hypothetical protein
MPILVPPAGFGSHNMERWMKERLWEVLVLLGGGLLAFGTLQARVTDLREKYEKLEDMPVALARMEEKIDRARDDIKELKK